LVGKFSWFGVKGVEMSKEGKTNLKIILASLFLLSVMSFMVFGASITIVSPSRNNITTSLSSFNVRIDFNSSENYHLNVTAVYVNFNGTYINDTKVASYTTLCSPTNISGGASTFVNQTNLTLNCTVNSSMEILNRGNWTIFVNVTNSSTDGGVSNGTFNNLSMYVIDRSTPRITAGVPYNYTDPRATNYTSFPIMFWATVVDPGNALSTVWYIVNSLNSVTVCAPSDSAICNTTSSGVNETNSSSVAANFSMAASAAVASNYTVNITASFLATTRGPGPHSVYICANDSAGNQNCSGPYNYIIKGGNYSDLLSAITGASSGDASFSMNFTYENGTPLEIPHFFAPTIINYTMKMNFTVPVGASGTVPVSVYLVGMAINESLMANMNNQNVSTEPPSSIREQAGGAGYNQSLAWLDIGNFLPSFVFFKFGIIKYINYQAFEKISMCNGSSVDSATCLQINPCPTTPRVPSNSSETSNDTGTFSNYTFIATQTGYNSSNLSLNQTIGACYVTDAGNTSIYTHRFSGGAAADDSTPPTVTLNSPTNGTNSTNVTLPINITINDTGGSGFSNSSGFLNLTVDGILFTYPTNLSCLPNTINVTGMTCFFNRSQDLKENSSLQIVVNVDDASGNRQNSTFVIKTDRTAPGYVTWNATNTYNGSGTDFNFSGNSNATSLGRSLSQSAKQGDKIFILINWSDTISGGGGINSRTATLEVLNSTDGLFHLVSSTTVIAANTTNGTIGTNGTPPYGNDSWTNLSWIIPTGHLYTEGINLTYRINLSDVLGNLNSTISNSVSNGTGTMNFSFTVNDTALPNVTVRLGTSSLQPVNGSNINLTGTTILINWSVNDPGGMRLINVSVDNGTSDTGCGEFSAYGPSVINNRVNFQIQYPSAGCSGSSVKGIESGALTNGTHNITFTAEDSWGNLFRKFVTFNIDNQPPGLTGITVTASSRAAIGNVNMTNIRFNDTFAVNVTDAGTGGVAANGTIYATGCNTTNVSFTLDSQFAPFNTSGCKGINIQTNLTLFYNDTSGNRNSTTVYVRLDDVAPTFVSTSITNGTAGANFTIKWNVTDAFMNVTDVSFYLDNSSTYTNTNTTGNMFNYSNGTGQASLNLSSLLGSTYVSGRHFIILSANDTVNSIVNSSPIYFSVDAPIVISDFLNNLTAKFGNSSRVGDGNVTAIEVYQLLANGTYANANTTTINASNTFRLLLGTNITNLNITLEFNGTEVNWAGNFTLSTNNSQLINPITQRYGKNILHTVYFDSSFDSFISNDDAYFGIARLPLGAGNYSVIYWFADENSINSTTDATTLSACSGSFTRTTSTPCYTDNNSFTLVFVPHFSAVVAANETTAPYINPDFTSNGSGVGGNITNSSFVLSFKTSLDVSNCTYKLDSSTTYQLMSISGTTLNKTCTGGLTNFSDGAHNVTFNASDATQSNQITFAINITDRATPTIPNNSIVNSSISDTSVVIAWNTTEYANSTVTVQAVTGTSPANTTDLQLVLAHSITVSSLSPETKYNFTVRSCDSAGNCNSSSAQFNFTTSANTSTSTSTSTSSGGGGGGGATTTDTNIVASKAQVFAAIAAGSSAVVNVNKADIAVTQVEVSVTKALSNVEIKVSSLKDKPTTVGAGEKVYQYLDISPKNIGASEVSKVAIAFKVTKAWLSSNGISASDVVLARYTSGSWTQLSTSKVSEDANSVSYSAESPGFSYYAITTKAVAAVAPPTEEKPVPEPEERPVVTPPEEKKPIEKVVEKVKEEVKEATKVVKGLGALTWVIVISIVAIGLIVYFIYSRKSKE